MTCKLFFSSKLLSRIHLCQHHALGDGARLLQHCHVLSQLLYGQFEGLQVALDLLQLLLLLPPQLFQYARLLVVQYLMEGSELTFDPSL